MFLSETEEYLVTSGTLDSLLGNTLADGVGSGDLSVTQDGSAGEVTSDSRDGSGDLLGVASLDGGGLGLWLVGVLGILNKWGKRQRY
jgi:hypothetical protein